MDWYLITHFGMAHPDIWLMWVTIILTPINTLVLAVLAYRKLFR